VKHISVLLNVAILTFIPDIPPISVHCTECLLGYFKCENLWIHDSSWNLNCSIREDLIILLYLNHT
jgi:hypothetical protein